VAGGRLAQCEAIGGATDGPKFIDGFEDSQQVEIQAPQVKHDPPLDIGNHQLILEGAHVLDQQELHRCFSAQNHHRSLPPSPPPEFTGQEMDWLTPPSPLVQPACERCQKFGMRLLILYASAGPSAGLPD
jgi:hypothetical protein